MSAGPIAGEVFKADETDIRLRQLSEVRDGLTGWTRADFFAADEFVYGIEFLDGTVELKAVPKPLHRRIATEILFRLYELLVKPGRAEVLQDGTNLRTSETRERKPDIVVTLLENRGREDDHSLLYADLVVEVLSPGDRRRDLVDKRADYASIGIPEYWIADPRDGSLTVLVLEDGSYREAARATSGVVASETIEGVTIDVDEVLGRFIDGPKKA